MKKLGIIIIAGIMLIGITSCGVNKQTIVEESTSEMSISEASEIVESAKLASSTDAPTCEFTEEAYNEFKETMNSFQSLGCLQINVLEADGVEIDRQQLVITCDLESNTVEWCINDGKQNKFDGKENIYYIENDKGELVENYGNIPTLGFNVNKLTGMWDLFEYLVGSDARELIGANGETNDEGYEYYEFTKEASSSEILGVEYDSLGDTILYTYIFKDGVPVSISATLDYTKDGVTYTTRTNLQFNNLKIGDEENAVK